MNEEHDQAKQTQMSKAEVEKEQNKAKKAHTDHDLLRTWPQREQLPTVSSESDAPVHLVTCQE